MGPTLKRDKKRLLKPALITVLSIGSMASAFPAYADDSQELIDETLARVAEYQSESEDYKALRSSFGLAEAAAWVTLREVMDLALEHDLQLAQSEERIDEAQEFARNARYGYYPRVSMQADLSYVSQDVISTDNQVFKKGEASFDTTRFQGEIVQPIIDTGRARAIKSADTGSVAARTAADLEQRNVTYKVISAYLKALESTVQLESMEHRLKILKAQQSAEQRKQRSGYGTTDGIHLLALEIGTAESDKITYMSEFARAMSELSRIIGRPVSKVAEVVINPSAFDSLFRASPNDLMIEAHNANPLVKLRKLESYHTKQQYSEQRAREFHPTLEGFVRSEWEDRQESRFGGGSETFDTTVGVRLNVPLFNANGQGYPSREARSRMRQSILREADAIRELNTEISNLKLRLYVEWNTYENSQKVVRSARELVSSAKKQAEAGRATEMMLLRQSLQLEMASSRAQKARLSYLSTMTRLVFLTGRSFTDMFQR